MQISTDHTGNHQASSCYCPTSATTRRFKLHTCTVAVLLDYDAQAFDDEEKIVDPIKKYMTVLDST